MQEKKLLRDALVDLVGWVGYHHPFHTPKTHKELHAAIAALASITEEMEMEKLVAWLKHERNDSIDRLNKARDREWRGEPVPGMERPAEYHAGQGNFCEYALHYITTQFGEEEGE